MQEEKNSLAPLQGLRIAEFGLGVAAPYAGQLLQLLGATVAKFEPPEGDPARTYPVDDRSLEGTSPLFRYLNAGKRSVPSTDARRAKAIEWADFILESTVRADADPMLLAAVERKSVRLAAVTAWGFDAEEPGEIDDELLVQATAGVLTLTGNVGEAPVRFPGFQSQYLAGAFTAAGIAAAWLAGEAGAHLIDVAWVSAIASGTEGSYQRYLHTKVVPPPAGANPVSAFPAGAFACADGFVVPGTVRQHDWEMQCLLYGRPELTEDPRFSTPAGRTENYRELWNEIQPWYDEHTRADIFHRALEVGWACGMVLNSADALSDAHVTDRAFLTQAEDEAGSWCAPARIAIGVEANDFALRRVSAPGDDAAWFDRMVGL